MWKLDQLPADARARVLAQALELHRLATNAARADATAVELQAFVEFDDLLASYFRTNLGSYWQYEFLLALTRAAGWGSSEVLRAARRRVKRTPPGSRCQATRQTAPLST